MDTGSSWMQGFDQIHPHSDIYINKAFVIMLINMEK